MKLTDRIKYAYSALVSKNFASQTLGNSYGSVMRNYSQGSNFTPQQQLRGITYKAVDKIGQAVSTYELQISKKSGDAYENHPLYALARQPNATQNGPYFFQMWAMLLEIYGETFTYKVRGEQSRKVKELYLLNPAQIELKMYNGELIGYVLHKSNGDQVPFELEEIYHHKRPNPFNEYRGMSVMERAAQYIDIELTTTSFTLNYMRNNASPSGIVSLPEMEKEAFKQFTMQWREGYEGPENAGKTAFIRGGEANFKAVGATLHDIDQKVTRDMAKDDVLMMFDVPKGLLGASGEKGLGRSETEALEYIFAKWKIDPIMDALDSLYEHLLSESPMVDRNGVVTHESPIPMDKEFNLKQNKEGVNRWITQNEARQSQGLPKIPGGDVLPPPEAVASASPQAQTKALEVKTKKVVLKKALTAVELSKKLNEEQEDFRSKLIDTNDIYAKKVKSTISKFAAQQEDGVINKINASSKAYEEWLFNIKEESEKLAELLMPIMLELMQAQGEGAANFITGELITITTEMKNIVETDIKRIAGIYNKDTIDALQKTLTAGQAENETLVSLKKRVEAVYSEAKGYRAERIARTESLKTSNFAAEQVYSQNGFSKVEWFINPGACEFCRSYSGRTKEVGAVFTPIGEVVDGADGGQLRIEYDDINTPPLHPNCTCSIVPVS